MNIIKSNNLIVKLLYGCGLRSFECLKLRVNNFNSDDRILTVYDGKGKKDHHEIHSYSSIQNFEGSNESIGFLIIVIN